jgi:hypothetical protein
MTLTFEHLEGALDCAQAMINAGRPYTFSRSAEGGYEITTRD